MPAIGDITATLSLGFVEPRYVLGVFGNVAAPYVAARFGYGGLLVRSPSDLVQSTDNSFIYGGGLGVIFQVASRVGIDVGAQYFVADFTGGQGSAGYFLTRLGFLSDSSRNHLAMRSAVQTFLAAALGLLVLAGCGGGDDGGGDCDPIAATLVSRIEVTPTTAAVADGESRNSPPRHSPAPAASFPRRLRGRAAMRPPSR